MSVFSMCFPSKNIPIYPPPSLLVIPTCVLLADGLLQGLIQRLRAQRVADQQQDVHLVLLCFAGFATKGPMELEFVGKIN